MSHARVFRVTLAGVMLGLLLGVGAGTAYAASHTSAIKWFTVNGHDYSNKAVMYDDGRSQTIHVRSGSNAPKNHIGGRARTYWDGGTLCSASVTRYNPTADYWFDIVYNSGCGGYVYSRGFSRTWNGTKYVQKSTYSTVNVGPL